LEAGAVEDADELGQKTWGLYLPMGVWIFCVSFAVLEYILDVRQLAWESFWLWLVALDFECAVLTNLVLFAYVAFGDPGVVPSNVQGGPEAFLRALRSGQNIPAKRLCTTTWVLKDLRTKYCKETGACVQEFDHFCDFTACAIGKKNHRVFIILLMIEPATQCCYLFLAAMIVLQTQGLPPTSVWEALTWAWQAGWRYPLMVIAAGIHLGSLPFVLYQLAAQLYMIANNVTFNDLQNWERYDHLWAEPHTPVYLNVFSKGDFRYNCLDFWWFRQRSGAGPRGRTQVRELMEALREAGAK